MQTGCLNGCNVARIHVLSCVALDYSFTNRGKKDEHYLKQDKTSYSPMASLSHKRLRQLRHKSPLTASWCYSLPMNYCKLFILLMNGLFLWASQSTSEAQYRGSSCATSLLEDRRLQKAKCSVLGPKVFPSDSWVSRERQRQSGVSHKQ